MIIYKGDYFCGSTAFYYDQNSFKKNLPDKFKSWKNDLIIPIYYYSQYQLCASLQEAINHIPYDNVVAIRVSAYEITDDQCKELITTKHCEHAITYQVWFYTLNVSSQQLDEFTMKAFL